MSVELLSMSRQTFKGDMFCYLLFSFMSIVRSSHEFEVNAVKVSKLEVDAERNASNETNPEVLNCHESLVFDQSFKM